MSARREAGREISTPFLSGWLMRYSYAAPVTARVASNLHADAAVRAGIAGAEVVATLHAELADAYAIVDELESRDLPRGFSPRCSPGGGTPPKPLR